MKLRILLMCLLVLAGCGRVKQKEYQVDAEVLSINSQILEGKLIGSLLSSPSGWIRTDINKVAVGFKLKNYLFLEDFELSHAQLAYYKDSSHIPIVAKVLSYGDITCRVDFFVNRVEVGSRYISREVSSDLVE